MTNPGNPVKRYRIRVGKRQFVDPHYVTSVGRDLSYTSLAVNKKPCSWVRLSTAMKHLRAVKERLPTAEIEEIEGEK